MSWTAGTHTLISMYFVVRQVEHPSPVPVMYFIEILAFRADAAAAAFSFLKTDGRSGKLARLSTKAPCRCQYRAIDA